MNSTASLTKKIQHTLLKLRHQHFEFGNKTSKLLANQLKQQTEKSNIIAVEDSLGNITQDHTATNETFRNYYSNLYTPDHTTTITEADTLLRSVSLLKLSTDQAHYLDKPLSINELEKALQHMPNNKSPGLDGFPVEFYKHFWPLISPLLLNMISETLHNSKIPHHMNTALITLILKPNKNPTQCSSYRPITLINTDVKIISKA